MNAPKDTSGSPSTDGQADRSPVRVGALAPLSQPGWVEAGRHLLAGLDLAVQEANSAGGIGGRWN